MKKYKLILYIIMVLFVCSCEDEHIIQPSSSGYAFVYAQIGKPDEVTTRAQVSSTTGTYITFSEGDIMGLYASDSIRTNDENFALVRNLPLKLENNKWGGEEPVLKWEVGPGRADIYAYFPYQEGCNGGDYNIFQSHSSSSGKLKDILIAERTTVENNNPAIFLTFRHRFALLHLSLGTGMAAIKDTDPLRAITDIGIAPTASIEQKDLVVKPQSGTINEFEFIKGFPDYYIIIPAGTVQDESSLKQISLTDILVGESISKLNTPIELEAGMIYHMTVHKDSEGSIRVDLGNIELWGEREDNGHVREQPGIYWASDLNALANEYNKANPDSARLAQYGVWDESSGKWTFNLMRNIDINDSQSYKNTSFNDFYGVFDGKGYTISGLDNQGNGLFNNVKKGSSIYDLTLKNVSVGGGDNCGALAGLVEDSVTIFNCHATGFSAVSGGMNVGGLIGSVSGAEHGVIITNCSSSADVTSTGAKTGGLIGSIDGLISIDNCFATGDISSLESQTGGLIGYSNSSKSVLNSYAACNVTGKNNVGGLIGEANNAVINCYAAGDIVGIQYVGGLIGKTSTDVSLSSASGSVKGDNIVGGLIGGHIFSGEGVVSTISKSYSRSVVTATSTKGGLIGLLTEYIPEHEVEIQPEDPEDPEEIPDPEYITVAAVGSFISNCYAANRLPLANNLDASGIEDSYDIGGTAGINGTYYTINVADANYLSTVAVLLNSPAWELGSIIIDGHNYTLPILTSNN